MNQTNKERLLHHLVEAEKHLTELRKNVTSAYQCATPGSEEFQHLHRLHRVLYADQVTFEGGDGKAFRLLEVGIRAIEGAVKPKPLPKEKVTKPKGKALPKQSQAILELLKSHAPNYLQKQRIADQTRLSIDEVNKFLEPLRKRNLIDGEREICFIG